MQQVIILAVFLSIVLAFLVLLRSIMRAYVKTPANRAFVRTGGLSPKPNQPPKVVMNGGAWVFRTIHEIIWVDLGTMAIEIERTGPNALLTKDPQYADIKAIFYIKVNPTVEGIIDAARTIGGKQVDAESVKQLVDAKLDGALRDVAASFTLMSLHQEREKFIQEVQNRLKTDLEENGLVLESVSILTLRAARQGSFGVDDVFGAQVARANAEVIQQALRERNDIERQAEIEIKHRDTETAKMRLDLDRQLALASATQEREIRSSQAMEKAQADQRVYEEDLKSEMARIAKERAVSLNELERDQEVSIRSERKVQEVMSAEVLRRQAVELAEQQRQIVVLKEQQNRETAEKEQLLVSAQREEASQAVKTVELTSQAQREAHIQVIEAERDAQRALIEQKNRIELEAMRKVREAEAQAKALKEIAGAEAEAAQKQAETLRTQAKAEMEAAKLRSEGTRATASAAGLADAQVLTAKAEAAMREADAIRAKGLSEAESEKAKAEALAAYDGVAQRVEMARLQLDAQVKIEVARAEALGSALAAMDLKLIGDPTAAAALLRMVTLSDGLREVFNAAPQSLQSLGQSLMDRFSGNGSQAQESDGGNHHAEKDPIANGEVEGIAELASLLPNLIQIIERYTDVNQLKGHSVNEVLSLAEGKASPEDGELLRRAVHSLNMLPILGDLPFEEVYLRAVHQ